MYYHETPAVVHQRRETPVHPLHACLDEARPLRHGAPAYIVQLEGCLLDR